MKIVSKSYDIVKSHKFINPIDECGVNYPPDINLICCSMDRTCPEVSKNI